MLGLAEYACLVWIGLSDGCALVRFVRDVTRSAPKKRNRDCWNPEPLLHPGANLINFYKCNLEVHGYLFSTPETIATLELTPGSILLGIDHLHYDVIRAKPDGSYSRPAEAGPSFPGGKASG